MSSAIQAHLDAEFVWLRLLLERRSDWLRSLWKNDREEWQGVSITDHEADLAISGAASLASEWRYYAENDRATAVGARIASARQHAGALRTPEAPLSRLARLFELTAFEQSVLIACLAPELDASFSTLYGYVQDDARRRFPTPHLMVALFAQPENRLEAAASLGESGALRRYRLVETGDGDARSSPLGARPLVIAGRILRYLIGQGGEDPDLALVTRPADDGWRPAWVEDAAGKVLSGIGTTRRINLAGSANAAKELIATAAASRWGCRLVVLEPQRLPGNDTERQNCYRLLDREARLAALAYYVPPQDSEPSGRLVPEIAGSLDAPLIIDTPERINLRQTVTVHVRPPSRAEQKSIWEEALRGVEQRVDGMLDSLVQQFDFSPAKIRDAVSEASAACPIEGPALWQVCRRTSGWKLEDLAQRITPRYGWDDIILGPDELRELREIAGQVAHRARVYEEWGFASHLSRGRGISALFSGPSGTGKTMAAEILSNALNLDLYVIDLAGIVSKYIGETEKNLRRVFDAAEQSGAILFFDEADALFGKRSEVKDSHDRYANIEVNYLLQKMEQYQGLAILSTNRKAALDRAFLRRLRFLVDFPFPARENREQIWRKMFPPEAPREDLDFQFLSRLEIAGGNIRNIAVNAAFLASAENSPIGASHVMRAVRQEYAKLDKLVTEAEFGAHYRGGSS